MQSEFKPANVILTLDNYTIERPIDPLSPLTHFNQDNTRHLVDHLNLSIFQDEILAIVGESGSGKSLTAHGILQLLPKTLLPKQTGKILFNGQNILTMTENEIRTIRQNEIAIIFQEPMVALNPVQTIGKQLEEILILNAKQSPTISSKKERINHRNESIAILKKVGLRSPETRLLNFAHQFSGGERQRIIIAMALLRKPKLLIADEATTALDVTTQKQIIDLLLDLKSEFGMTLMFISHNLHLVRKIADRVAVMHQGQCVEINTTEAIFSQPKSDYTQSLIAAHNSQLKFEKHDTAKMPSTSLLPTLEIHDLKVLITRKSGWFSKVSFPILEKFDLTLACGNTIGIVGESGSGKSTTAFAITKLIQSTGQVTINGIDTTHMSEKEFKPLRRDVQIIFQDPFSTLNPKRTIKQTIEEGLEVHEPNLSITEREYRVCEVLSEIGLDPEMRHRYPHQFSGGQRQRIAIARALILKPKLLILDEPTSALDKKIEIQILSLLKVLQNKYQLSYLFISHDLATVQLMCDAVIVLKEGKIVETGSTEDIFLRPKQEYTKQLVTAATYG